ncbi:sel1 repeat family protein [Catenulispora rubra]|uniref:sel1 repeat family protein n=1 Tax=Catenulispora rubra TaxID=280293 RepID=UPI0018925E45|nr:sel1 repeat family protein [Catenulispora rubra]
MRKAAESGDAQASYALGMHYVGKWRDHFNSQIHLRSDRRLSELACLHLRRAADAGHADAGLQLARALAKERSRPAAPEEDQFWSNEEERYLAAAAESGHTHAAFILGAMHLRLARYSSDTSDAERHLRQAADGGHAKAAYHLGEWLLRQEGRQADAEHYLRLAADRTDADPRACIDLARILTRTQRSDLAEPYVRAALDSNYKGRYYHLEPDWMELLGDVLNRTRRRAEAKEWYDKARARRSAPKWADDWPDLDGD